LSGSEDSRIAEEHAPVINRPISADELLDTTGYDRVGDLRRSLDEQGIRYFLGKGGKPWTTLGLIEASAKGAAALEDRLLGPDDV
jgi:hypothetical protein